MKEVSQKELLEMIDEMNKDEFKYVGVMHIRSGCRTEVEMHNEFIINLGVSPIKEFKIKKEQSYPDSISKYFITIEVSQPYVNIYEYEQIKNKVPELTKDKCVANIKVKETL